MMRARDRRERDDAGVTVVLVVLIVTAVFLGLGAIVVDFGGWYEEKAQVQNGADGAALAVAQTCVTSSGCDTSLTATGTAGKYANANANDAATLVDEVCGNGPNLLACTHTSGPGACPGAPSAYPSAKYVNVHTATLNRDGSKGVPVTVGQFIPGNNVTSEAIPACSQVAWGAPQVNGGLALTISYCAWNQATSGGSQSAYAPQPPYPPYPSTSLEHIFFFHGKPDGSDATGNQACPTPSSGSTPISGGFGSTCEIGASNCSNQGTSCNTALNRQPNNWFDNNPGASLVGNCQTALAAAWSSRTPVLIPVYDCTSNVPSCLTKYPCSTCSTSGSNADYHLASLAAFVITGYKFPGNTHNGSWLPGSTWASDPPCSGSNSCITGFFTTATTSGDLGGSLDTGVEVIKMTG